MRDLVGYLLASVGLTVLIVWPSHGPSAWLRERVLRPLLPTAARGVIDCYICWSFWIALSLSPLWRWLGALEWIWFGCLMVPGLFWLILRPDRSAARRSAEELP